MPKRIEGAVGFARKTINMKVLLYEGGGGDLLLLASMWGSVFSSTRMATELVGVASKNNMVSFDVNNLKKFLPGEVLLQEVEVMVVAC